MISKSRTEMIASFIVVIVYEIWDDLVSCSRYGSTGFRRRVDIIPKIVPYLLTYIYAHLVCMGLITDNIHMQYKTFETRDHTPFRSCSE